MSSKAVVAQSGVNARMAELEHITTRWRKPEGDDSPKGISDTARKKLNGTTHGSCASLRNRMSFPCSKECTLVSAAVLAGLAIPALNIYLTITERRCWVWSL